MYKRMQLNKTLLVILVIISAAVVLTSADYLSVLVAIAINLVLAGLFWSMTVEVKNTRVSWYFGSGFFRKELSALDIVETSTYQTKWYQGIGIRLLKDGWLYNASVGSALKLTMKSGNNVYLGCPDIERLQKELYKVVK